MEANEVELGQLSNCAMSGVFGGKTIWQVTAVFLSPKPLIYRRDLSSLRPINLKQNFRSLFQSESRCLLMRKLRRRR